MRSQNVNLTCCVAVHTLSRLHKYQHRLVQLVLLWHRLSFQLLTRYEHVKKSCTYCAKVFSGLFAILLMYFDYSYFHFRSFKSFLRAVCYLTYVLWLLLFSFQIGLFVCLFVCLFKVGISTDKTVYLKRSYAKRKKKKRKKRRKVLDDSVSKTNLQKDLAWYRRVKEW